MPGFFYAVMSRGRVFWDANAIYKGAWILSKAKLLPSNALA